MNSYISRKVRNKLKMYGGLDPTNLLGWKESDQYNIKTLSVWVNLLASFLTKSSSSSECLSLNLKLQ